jgi:hypothetical protein
MDMACGKVKEYFPGVRKGRERRQTCCIKHLCHVTAAVFPFPACGVENLRSATALKVDKTVGRIFFSPPVVAPLNENGAW